MTTTLEHTYQDTGVRDDVLSALQRAGSNGVTAAEMRMILGLHHGATSGAMSDLHAMGKIARTSDRRNRYRVYVLPAHLGNRIPEPHGRRG